MERQRLIDLSGRMQSGIIDRVDHKAEHARAYSMIEQKVDVRRRAELLRTTSGARAH
jgi:hypothetical protein